MSGPNTQFDPVEVAALSAAEVERALVAGAGPLLESIRLFDVFDVWFGDFAADFDVEAVRADYINAIDAAAKQIVPSISVTASGVIYVEHDDAEAAGAIDWDELTAGIDLGQIAARHERPATATIAQA